MKTANDDVNRKTDQAKALFEEIAPMFKDVPSGVLAAVIAALLAGYVGAHEPPDREGAVDRLLFLASKLVDDIDGANGIETAGGLKFEMAVDDSVRQEMESNPKLAEFVRESTSRVRQALSDYQAGKYRSVDEAMKSIGLDEVEGDDLEELRDRMAPGRKLS